MLRALYSHHIEHIQCPSLLARTQLLRALYSHHIEHIQCPSLLARTQLLRALYSRALYSHHIESCKFVTPACDTLTLLCVPEDIQLDRGKGGGGGGTADTV